MKTTQAILTVALAAAAAFSHAQAWMDPYEKAVTAANSGQWAEAREAFKAAAAIRQEDSNKATYTGGSLTERVAWRNGSPYSPNFGAAYASYRLGMAATDGSEATRHLILATQEGQALATKGQVSLELAHMLETAFTKLAAMGVDGASAAAERTKGMAAKARWKVDNSFVSAEDRASAAPTAETNAKPTKAGPTKVSKPKAVGTKGNSTFYTVKAGTYNSLDEVIADPSEKLEPKPDKFALVIGNSDSKLEDQKLDFAASDAELVKATLVDHAGYRADNVMLLANASASQILAAAKELAAKVPEYGTVLIYFTGSASNVDGKDYLAGVGANSMTDTSNMVAKMDLFREFMTRGAKVFSFFQVNRTNREGNVFGSEIPRVGQIAQMEATLPGSTVTTVTSGAKTQGVFTRAFTQVLTKFHTNSVPLLEFAWQVFYTMRRGGELGTGGGSEQTPTLPVLSNMSSDTPF
ncbi:MAG: caspase family protein [Armatimonadetes bacterium]|nr:caspase family protein [Armatimonadota bacterium]